MVRGGDHLLEREAFLIQQAAAPPFLGSSLHPLWPYRQPRRPPPGRGGTHSRAGQSIHSHCDFEDSQQPQRSEDGEAEGARLGLQVGPDDLEDAAGDDQAVEAVKGGLEVDPRPQGPHSQQHFEDEQAQEDVLGGICRRGRNVIAVPFYRFPLT